MITRICLSLCLALAGFAFSVPSASAYTPPAGVIFNRPIGSKAERYAMHRHIDKAIDSVRRGGTIRFASYSMDRAETRIKLVRAHRRGVNVKLIFNHHWNTAQIRRLKQVLGTNIRKRSFVKVCRNGCRSPRASAMHSKYFMFTHSGRARYVVMTSSGNLTGAAANWQWNDLHTIVGHKNIYGAFARLHREMARDRPVRNPYRVNTSGRFRTYFYPRPGTTRATDTMWEALSQVRCRGAAGRSGRNGRTIIRVSMYTWSGERGMYLARKLRALDAAGCYVYVNYGAPARDVARELRRPGTYGGIEVRDSRFDRNGDGQVDLFLHHKYMMINGVYGSDREAFYVFTGSHNWVPPALRFADELSLRIAGKGSHDRYLKNFNDVRRTGSRAVANRTVSLANAFSGGPYAKFGEQIPLADGEPVPGPDGKQIPLLGD